MVNLMKTKNVLFIVEGTNDEPHFIKQLLSKCYPSYNYKIYSYDAIDYAKIFDIQYENLQKGFIWILNTCILILIDYKPSSFFEQIQKHTTSFLLPF